jgi:hypothetical protein
MNPGGKQASPAQPLAADMQDAVGILEGRWKRQ